MTYGNRNFHLRIFVKSGLLHASSSSFSPGPFIPQVTDHKKDCRPNYKNKAKQGLSYAIRGGHDGD
jgi:hypothetical protein